MKILRTYIGRLLLIVAMFSGSLHMVAQPIFNSASTPISTPCAQPDCQDAIYIGNNNTPTTTVASDTYSSENILHSDGTVDDTSTVDYKSNYVRLDIGFSTEVGADFSAEIEACEEDNTGGVGSESPDLECLDYLYVSNDNTPGATIPSNLYQAKDSLKSDGTIAVQDIVRQKAGHHVTLKPGFKALKGSVFRGYIEDCSEGASTGTYYVNDASQIGDIYTSAPGSNSTGNGTPSKPFATLKHVIQTQVLTGGDIIYIDSGVYDDTFVEINNPINNLTIRGAGAHNTIFDNNYTDNDIEGDDVSNGNLFMRIYTDGISLEGFTVREYNYLDLNGNVNGLDGKAISVKGAECVLFNGLYITENAAGSNNGYSLSSLFIHSGSVDVLNSFISNNQSQIDGLEGGGIDIYELNEAVANVNIINSLISDNIRSDRSGGGMQILGEHNVYIDNSTISNNISKLYGGGIYVAGANININNSCISRNTANEDSSKAGGGGIYIAQSSNVNTYNTVFDTNISGGANQGKGGAICVNNLANMSVIKLEQSKFENNQAAEGNHIYLYGQLDANEVQFLPETDAISTAGTVEVYIQNSGTPEVSPNISFINNTPPQNYATPSCNSQVDCTANAGFDQTLCSGESIQIGTTPQDGLTYYWEPSTGLDDPYTANPTANPSETTTYTLHVGGCGGRGFEDEVTVYVSEGDITFPPNQVTCGGTNILLNVGGGTEYAWTPTAGLSCTDCPNPTANVNETSTFSVTVTDDNGCEITRDITITVAGNLAISISAEPEGIICPGETVQLNATGAVDYIWSPADGGLSNPNISNPTVSPSDTTTYTVIGFQDECQAVGQITLNTAPEYGVTINYDLSGCTLELEAVSDVPLNTYEWSIDNVVMEDFANMPFVNYGFTHSGTYKICLTVTGDCGEDVTVCENVTTGDCTCTDCSTLYANPTAFPNNDCQRPAIRLRSNAGGGTPPYSYSWTGPNGFTSSLENVNISDATSTRNGIYTFTITDSNDCEITVETEYVQLHECCVIDGVRYVIGEPCDDGDPNTVNETIYLDTDGNCNCGINY